MKTMVRNSPNLMLHLSKNRYIQETKKNHPTTVPTSTNGAETIQPAINPVKSTSPSKQARHARPQRVSAAKAKNGLQAQEVKSYNKDGIIRDQARMFRDQERLLKLSSFVVEQATKYITGSLPTAPTTAVESPAASQTGDLGTKTPSGETVDWSPWLNKLREQDRSKGISAKKTSSSVPRVGITRDSVQRPPLLHEEPTKNETNSDELYKS
ncbi:hypothetical protein NHQ30_001685 [Ciborinia camelliae]|nr:hypothetical protein NHQ30_001685 [Ciborinia camelliae]